MRLAIPSVNYADFLAVTLPAWLQLVDRSTLLVVTAPNDLETCNVAERYGVPLFVTDAWTRTDPRCHVNARPMRRMKAWRDRRTGDRPTMNLALALDEAFGLPMDEPRVFGVVDADCVPFGTLPCDDAIAAGVIYGAWRYACLTQLELEAHRAGARPLEQLRRMQASGRIEDSQHRDVPNVGEGYCQIFRSAPGLRFGSYPAADEYDFDFALKFRRGVLLESFYLLHLGQNAKNWDGRVTPRWEVHA